MFILTNGVLCVKKNHLKKSLNWYLRDVISQINIKCLKKKSIKSSSISVLLWTKLQIQQSEYSLFIKIYKGFLKVRKIYNSSQYFEVPTITKPFSCSLLHIVLLNIGTIHVNNSVSSYLFTKVLPTKSMREFWVCLKAHVWFYFSLRYSKTTSTKLYI